MFSSFLTLDPHLMLFQQPLISNNHWSESELTGLVQFVLVTARTFYSYDGLQ
jgi:hypothetical protein